MTSSSKTVLAAAIVASCSSSLEPKCANRPLLLIPTASARRASDRPSRPSTVAIRAASRRIAARLRAPSDRCRRVRREGARSSEIGSTLDKLARLVVLSRLSTTDRANYNLLSKGSRMTAISSVDPDQLAQHIASMYRDVANETGHDLHFHTGRALAEALGYPADLLDRLPAQAVSSFAGVGYHLGLARVVAGECVLDVGSGSGLDVLAAAAEAGPAG